MSGGKDAMMQTSQRDSGSESGELNSDGSSCLRDPVYVVGFGTMTYGDAMLLVQQGTIPAPSTDRSQLEPNTPLPHGFIVILAGVPQVGSAEPPIPTT